MDTSAWIPLNDSLQQHTLALFVGADLGRDISGLPSRVDLARELARRYRLPGSLSLADVAQRVGQGGNRFEFTNFIRTALDTAGQSPAAFHRHIAALVKDHSLPLVITTAYDNLIELAFQQAGIGFNRVARSSDVNFIRPDRPTLIRLYGDAQQPDTLIITDRDHLLLLRDRDKEDVVNEVRSAFKRYTILFCGYDLSDPDFKFRIDQIADSRFARLAYAVWPGLPAAEVQMWRDRGIVILEEAAGLLSGLGAAPDTSPAAKPSTTNNAPGSVSPAASTSSTDRVSGGVTLAGDTVRLNGDVTGRDKIVDQSTHGDIYHIHIEHADHLTVASGVEMTGPAANEPASQADALSAAERAALHDRLTQARENLRLIEEHPSVHTTDMDTDLPPTSQQRYWQARIAELEQQLGPG